MHRHASTCTTRVFSALYGLIVDENLADNVSPRRDVFLFIIQRYCKPSYCIINSLRVQIKLRSFAKLITFRDHGKYRYLWKGEIAKFEKQTWPKAGFAGLENDSAVMCEPSRLIRY